MKREILKSKQVRQKLLDGVLELSSLVGATMGPKGRNILIERKFGYPTITNDGVTIAREVELEDPYENMGAQIIMEAASRTNDSAGDGTTTATVLAAEMIESGLELIDARHTNGKVYNPVMLKKGMHKAAKMASDKLEEISKKIKTKDDMKNVASISSQSEEAGEVIAEAFDKVGSDGAVQVEDGDKLGYSLEMMEGMRVQGSLYNPFLATDERGRAVLEDTHVLVTNSVISNFDDLFPILDGLVKNKQTKLVLFCDSVIGNTIKNLIVNKTEGRFICIPIKVDATGDRKKDLIEDIAIATGATVVGANTGVSLNEITMKHLGFVKKAIVGKDTVLIGGRADEIKLHNRIAELRQSIKNTTLEFDRELMAERLAKLSGGVAIVKVGASSEIELKELKYRLEDALNATRAAIEEGIVPGGGLSLLEASEAIEIDPDEDEEIKAGMTIVKYSLERPFRQIIKNAGDIPLSIKEEIKSKGKGFGYNAAKGEVEDLMKSGIIDPKKVSRLALENAVSIAGIFLTTEGAISIKPNKNE